MIRWARDKGYPWDSSVCADVARNGNLELLRLVRDYGCPWGASTTAMAAQGGHIACMLWAHSQGCPMDETACAMAAAGGQVEVLVFLYSGGFPWDETTCTMAARYGHFLELVESMPMIKVVHGVQQHVLLLPKEAIWKSYNMPMRRAVHWMNEHVLWLLLVDTCVFCSGIEPMDALGTRQLFRWPKTVDIWKWYNGPVTMVASNTSLVCLISSLQNSEFRILRSSVEIKNKP
ncbi:ankyrin repeat protein [Seminavis robusta]|uniref:Ankyrin repeat protein n=1 Tax=Seminavis robusta TaxID=568900 RepID=A0A9N8F1Q5_9STRA|nr:ankyrin repeat protein [Seminavis robusta]|eukprot:Sro2567_g331490.1 ankyrin repeat protein (232) ;mRNA; r:12272-12967